MDNQSVRLEENGYEGVGPGRVGTALNPVNSPRVSAITRFKNEHRDIAKIAMRPTGLGNTGTRGEALWLLPAQPVAAAKPLLPIWPDGIDGAAL